MKPLLDHIEATFAEALGGVHAPGVPERARALLAADPEFPKLLTGAAVFSRRNAAVGVGLHEEATWTEIVAAARPSASALAVLDILGEIEEDVLRNTYNITREDACLDGAPLDVALFAWRDSLAEQAAQNRNDEIDAPGRES